MVPRVRHSATLLLAAMAALMVAGCSSLQPPELKEPSVRLERVSVLQLGMEQQRFGLTLAVTNPNALALRIRELDYAVALAGVDLAEGRLGEAFTLSANDTTEVEVEADTQLLQRLPELMRLVRSDTDGVDYTLTGNVAYGDWFRGEQPFSHSGSVTLQRP
ncbi:MAG: LEA type 2 family protein [Ectothiorhodospiraceae bacterium]